jgi:sarcosine oxidase subunit beta
MCASQRNSSFDVAVIGAGVIGCSVALALAGTGRRVCVVERGGAAGCGSTSASSALVRFNYSTWEGVATAWESLHAWRRWRQHLGVPDEAGLARFFRTGGLVLDVPGPNHGQDRSTVLSLFDRAGVPYEEWDAVTIAARLPHLDLGRYFPPKPIADPAFWADATGTVSGVWTPDCGFIDDPQLAAHNLMAAAAARGAQFRFHATVTGIRRNERGVAGLDLADGATVDARNIVNVAGPHSSVINELAGVSDDFAIKTRPLRQEVHEVRAPDGYNPGPGAVIADLDLGTYFRGTPSGRLIVGGLEPECDPLQWLDDPDDYNVKVTKPVFDAQVLRAARRLPSLTVPDSPRGIAGVYDVADDWIPIYDKTPLPGFYVAIGTSGNQFKNAPVVGSFLAEIIAATEQGHDHDRDPVRMTLPLTGHEINLGHYSRRREIHRESSFSVMG